MNKLLHIDISPEDYFDKKTFENILSKKSSISIKKLSYRIQKESLDCRKEPVYHLNVLVSENNDLPTIGIEPFLNVKDSMPVIVVGAGPCGLFAALKLIQKGLKPIIIERGKPIEERKKDTAKIIRNEGINEDSNFCFGEGGAGTFSDGKLYTRSTKKGNIDELLRLFVHFGAKQEILYQAHPHIGTDVLCRIIKNIRNEITLHGGEYRFSTKIVNLIVKDDEIKGVKTSEGEDIMAQRVILSTGHSAHDIYQLFYDNNWQIEPQSFALGVRIEHPQELINTIQYHNSHNLTILPPAEYSLTVHADQRSIHTFCMCPGGVVIPTPDKNGVMVVNGMSSSSRRGKFANSAVVVGVDLEDAKKYSDFGALSLMKLQQECEQKMYIDRCFAPAQRMTDFLNKKESSSLAETSYHPGLISMDLHKRLPKFVSDSLIKGLFLFDNKMKGYITQDSNLIGLESRTSSPVRISRDKTTMQHVQIKHLYPCGEGAGYAGGITSSALDGINVANIIAKELGV